MRRRQLFWITLAVCMLLPVVAMAADCPPPSALADNEFGEYQGRGWGWMFLASFGFGFLTSLTPCVYPMIPITLAIFGARGKDVSKRRAVTLATAYVIGMGVTYSVLGVTFALIGKAGAFGAQLANPWLVFPLIVLFLVLAASMFGAFDLNLPSGIQARLNQIGGKGYGGAFAMGLVGGLIAAPCTGPFLAGLLAFVSTTGSVVGGGSLLFTYAIGMGILFWVLAAFALALPKSGRWMEAVKSASGIGLVFAAIYFLKPFIPWVKKVAVPDIWFLIVAIVVGVVGIVLGAVHLTFHGTWRERLQKALGVVLVLAGAVGVWAWLLTPKHKVPWVKDEVAAFERARTEGKGVMVDFAADWCLPCEELELTFGDSEVYEALMKDFIPLKLDVTESTEKDLDLRARYGAETLPSVVFMRPDGCVLGRVNKFIEPDAMLKVIRPAASFVGAEPTAAK